MLKDIYKYFSDFINSPTYWNVYFIILDIFVSAIISYLFFFRVYRKNYKRKENKYLLSIFSITISIILQSKMSNFELTFPVLSPILIHYGIFLLRSSNKEILPEEPSSDEEKIDENELYLEKLKNVKSKLNKFDSKKIASIYGYSSSTVDKKYAKYRLPSEYINSLTIEERMSDIEELKRLVDMYDLLPLPEEAKVYLEMARVKKRNKEGG